MKKLLEKILRILTKAILARYNPEVVAITGSVGKTTTKDAIYTVLASTYNVRKNLKNYNNEIGIPLSVIGAEAGGKSLIKWFFVFVQALGLLIIKDKNYPNILVLEMGADKPGDIAYLTDLVPVKVGVVTAVAPAHIEFFENLDQIAIEKGTLVKALPENGFAILNADDKKVFQMGSQTKAKVVTYGLTANVDFQAGDIQISYDSKNISGLSFKLRYQGNTEEVVLPKIIGKHFVGNILAAIAVGKIYDLDLLTVIKSLKDFETPRGRMKLIRGIKKTLLIDDSYNSSPQAATQALNQLAALQVAEGKKYAVLGDMLELGRQAEKFHNHVGQAVAQIKADYLVTVGELSRDVVRGAIEAGMAKDRCFNFRDSPEAGKFLQKRISQGDLLLIKGSRGIQMEKVVKELMAQPERAKELLVGQ